MEDREGSGHFDELFVEGLLHLEWMDGHTWWMRVGDVRLEITAEPGEAVVVDIDRGAYGEPCGATRGLEKMDEA